MPKIQVYHRAGNGTRTRDPNLGKVVLYQLSYSRTSSRRAPTHALCCRPSGGEGNRTPDLLNAIQALSQLSYTPGPRETDVTPTPPRRPTGRHRVPVPWQKRTADRSRQEPPNIAEGICDVKKSGLAE